MAKLASLPHNKNFSCGMGVPPALKMVQDYEFMNAIAPHTQTYRFVLHVNPS